MLSLLPQYVVGMNRVVFSVIKVLFHKVSPFDEAGHSLLQCGRHLGLVCDLLLLPTNAAWLLKVNLKILVL